MIADFINTAMGTTRKKKMRVNSTAYVRLLDSIPQGQDLKQLKKFISYFAKVIVGTKPLYESCFCILAFW